MPKTIRLNTKDLRWCALVLFTLTCLPQGGEGAAASAPSDAKREAASADASARKVEHERKPKPELAAAHKPKLGATTMHKPKPEATTKHKPKPKPEPTTKHKPKPKSKHEPKPKPTPNPLPTPNPSPTPPSYGQVTVTITVHVSGNVAFLNNGIPTVAPRPIAGAQVSGVGSTTSGEAITDAKGNCTFTVGAEQGSSVLVCATALTYVDACQDIQATVASASVEFVLADNTDLTSQRYPLFDGTGAGTIDNQGNEYRYLGRGEYYTMINGQLQIFLPFGGGEYSSFSPYTIGYYNSDQYGNYDFGGVDYYSPQTGILYQPVGPGYYLSASGAYFKPLP